MLIEKFKIEEWMNKYESLAKYDMTTTCINSFSLGEFFDFTGANISEILDRPLHYGDITGSERLKSDAAKLYKGKSAKNVSVTLGAIGANSLTFFFFFLLSFPPRPSSVPNQQSSYSSHS